MHATTPLLSLLSLNALSGPGFHHPLRVLLILLLGVLAIGLGLVSHWEAQTMQNDADELLQRLQRARTLVLQDATHKDRHVAAALILRRMEDQGMVGEERRDTWLTAIRDIHRQQRLFDIHWTLDGRRPLESMVSNQTPPKVFASRLHLEMSLLHEEDLLVLLDELGKRLPALIQPLTCRWTALSQSETKDRDAAQPRLHGRCEVDLITFLPIGLPGNQARP